MASVLEHYGSLFERFCSGDRVEPFFLDPKLLRGPRSEIRRQLLKRLREQPPRIREASAPIVRFLAHFVDDYQRYEQAMPGFFAELNAWMKDRALLSKVQSDVLAVLSGESQGPIDEKTLSIMVELPKVMQAYVCAKQVLDDDLNSLGVRTET